MTDHSPERRAAVAALDVTGRELQTITARLEELAGALDDQLAAVAAAAMATGDLAYVAELIRVLRNLRVPEITAKRIAAAFALDRAHRVNALADAWPRRGDSSHAAAARRGVLRVALNMLADQLPDDAPDPAVAIAELTA